MNTRYTTGQSVLIPAVIKSAEEVNGQIIYHVDGEFWDGIPEDDIIVNEEVTARIETDREMRRFVRDLYQAFSQVA